ncbi:DUF4126 domain-containing protein [Zunongwangia sp. F363]|uniref:DUF4126 domain-containing protein n=1 Tax=Autumnicola tepida TaxID=3075595 RepID=A0ABU3CCM3_9FLAO|nr:DUF4126 domain-containing protein [Zunongwangia sp. F363]MDT0643780.1 DUF4126 domain-containing protein [Zunongwangia sp. F363]
MSVAQIIAILGSIPLFSLRTFLPAFLTALLLSYPEYFPGMGDVAPLPEDAFLSKDWVLIVLGGLSILEIIGDKSTEIRNLIKGAETYLKPLSFLLINLSMIDEASAEILKEVQWAAIDPLWILLAIGALAVHWLARLRKNFIDFLEDIDEDDNLFIGKISSWVEDSLVLFGFFLLIWTGIVMVVLYAAAIGIILILKKRYHKKLEKQKVECTTCGERNLPFATQCSNCKQELSEIHKIGVLGQRKEALVKDRYEHRLDLLSHKRCPDCGNKLKSNKIQQQCEICGAAAFNSPGVQEYLKMQNKKFYKITGLSFLLGFIPVLGFVISAVLANIYLFSPYRRYISRSSSFFTKLFIKFITFLFFLFGIALGFLAAPAYILMRYYLWKKKFLAQVKN